MFSSRSKAKPEDDRPGLGRSKAMLDRKASMGMPSLFQSMPSMREGVAKMKYDTKGFLLRSKKSFKKYGFNTGKKKPKPGEEISGRTKGMVEQMNATWQVQAKRTQRAEMRSRKNMLRRAEEERAAMPEDEDMTTATPSRIGGMPLDQAPTSAGGGRRRRESWLGKASMHMGGIVLRSRTGIAQDEEQMLRTEQEDFKAALKPPSGAAARMAAIKRETRIYKPVMGNPESVLAAHRDVRLAAEATERIRTEKLRLLKEARETREAIAITSHVRQVYENLMNTEDGETEFDVRKKKMVWNGAAEDYAISDFKVAKFDKPVRGYMSWSKAEEADPESALLDNSAPPEVDPADQLIRRIGHAGERRNRALLGRDDVQANTEGRSWRNVVHQVRMASQQDEDPNTHMAAYTSNVLLRQGGDIDEDAISEVSEFSELDLGEDLGQPINAYNSTYNENSGDDLSSFDSAPDDQEIPNDELQDFLARASPQQDDDNNNISNSAHSSPMNNASRGGTSLADLRPMPSLMAQQSQADSSATRFTSRQSGDMREGTLGGAAAADQANAAPTSAARPTTLSELLDVHQSPELHGHASQSGSGSSVSTVISTDEEDEWDQADI